MELLRMPRASENMVEGTVGIWLAGEGIAVLPGTPVVEIITEKAQFELECETAGTVVRQLTPSRSTVPTGYILCVIASDGEVPDIDAAETENRDILARHMSSVFAGDPLAVQEAPRPAAQPRASATPRARKLAKDTGVDLDAVRAALGVDGLVEEKHVREYIDRQG